MDQDTIDSINRRLDMLEDNLDRLLQIVKRVEESTQDVPRLVRWHKYKHDWYCPRCKQEVYTDMGGRYPQFNWCRDQNCCSECAIRD